MIPCPKCQNRLFYCIDETKPWSIDTGSDLLRRELHRTYRCGRPGCNLIITARYKLTQAVQLIRGESVWNEGPAAKLMENQKQVESWHKRLWRRLIK